jgi:hypothetical protein
VVCLSAAVIFLNTKYSITNSALDKKPPSSDKLEIVRDRSYKFTRPLRYFETKNQSNTLESLKEKLKSQISENKENGTLFQASVYLRDLENGEWTTINEDVGYHPGSLIKVPMMIYYLKNTNQTNNY